MSEIKYRPSQADWTTEMASRPRVLRTGTSPTIPAAAECTGRNSMARLTAIPASDSTTAAMPKTTATVRGMTINDFIVVVKRLDQFLLALMASFTSKYIPATNPTAAPMRVPRASQ